MLMSVIVLIRVVWVKMLKYLWGYFFVIEVLLIELLDCNSICFFFSKHDEDIFPSIQIGLQAFMEVQD